MASKHLRELRKIFSSVWHDIFAGLFFSLRSCNFFFCVLRELIFAIRTVPCYVSRQAWPSAECNNHSKKDPTRNRSK